MIQIKSFNQILGNMVRKIIAETPLSDVNPGSVFLSLLEACASNDFENNVAILNVLELLSVDSIRNSDLDNKAADFGMTRRAAVAASGSVSVLNTNISKQSSSLYSLKPAPIAGQTVLFITNTSGWAASGTLYIGRGTTSFEGPIPYTSITKFGTYSQVNLGAALQKDHLSSDTVVNAQGQPDRRIAAGTVVKIPANNQSAETLYTILRDAVIPAGEDRVDNVLVVAQVPGTRGNALINTIRQFDSAPFSGAAVTNTQAFTSGMDMETDVQLRNRIKSFAATLARGTSNAILNAVVGLSDPDENKRVVSAVLTNPISLGAPSILYVDDGNGFQPSYAGQAVDVLVARANGSEEFLQLANYPLPRPQVTNTAVGPFSMTDEMFFRVAVDGEEDVVVFDASDFANISVATVFEIVAAINSRSTLFKARLDNNSNNILLYPVDPDTETLQVVPLRAADDETLYANNVLNFPTNEVSYIALYQNSTRLKQRAKKATVQTAAFATWNLSDGNLILSVDGTPAQNGSFTLADFPGVTSYSLLTVDDWVQAMNAKFAGITAAATPSQTMQITSNKSDGTASIEILGGTYQTPMFGTNNMSAVGQESQFEINRQTGNLRILTDIVEGDVISAGVTDAKGYVVSAVASNGIFNFDDDAQGRSAELIVVADATKCDRIPLNLQIGDTLTVTSEAGNFMRITASTLAAFKSVQPGHYIYIADRDTWFSSNNTGFFRVTRRGDHTSAGINTWIEVHSNNITPESVVVSDVDDISAFETDAYPQIWRSSFLSAPATTTLNDLVTSFNKFTRGIRASVFRTTSMKLTSTTEVGGSIAIPVSVGRMSLVFPASAQIHANNEPLIAAKVPQKDMVGFPKLGTVTSGNSFLSRSAYPLVSGVLSADAESDVPPYAAIYSEEISSAVLTDANVNPSDIVLFTHGDNKGTMRAIAAKTAATSVGTQQGLPRTLFDHIGGHDELMLVQSLKFGPDDSVVCVLDNDAAIKTIDISLARSGKVNSGSTSASFTPTTTEFSADDIDNEAGIDFGTLNVWGTAINGTDFSDYAILMRARNWYASGGTLASAGKFIVRSAEYGPNGNKMRFSLEYPSTPAQVKRTTLVETPSYNLFSYYFGSGAARSVGIAAGTTITAVSAGSNLWDLTFSAGTFTTVQVGDILSLHAGSGMHSSLVGQFRVQSVAGSTLRVYNLNGSAGTFTITNSALVYIFPLTGTTVADIVDTINISNVLVAAPISDVAATVTKSTRDDQYAFTSNATALAYGHNPDIVADQASIALFDGINWVKKFQNTNPNFITKTAFTLTSSGVSSSVYAMHTALNENGTVGEFFRLVPTTAKNVQHHFTQKTMSQLPILSNVNLADEGKRVQIVTKKLGSAGGIQVLGGQANLAQTDLVADSQVSADSSGSYLLATVAAFPNSYAAGDVVKMQNRAGVRRLSRLGTNDTISVVADGVGFADYFWNAKSTGFVATTTFTITDVSVSDYDMDAGMVFRWTHSTANSETLANVNAGDVVAARDTGWAAANLAKTSGDGKVSGLPIIKVDNVNHYFDVVCPNGAAMVATAIGAGTVSIFPTPQIRWNLAHVAGSTKYRLETLGINGFVRLAQVDGVSPRFVDAGVAVDDYIIISGTTFNSLNNGTYRVVAVDNDSVVFENPYAIENTTALTAFNDSSIPVTWVANSATVSGVVGAFASLSVGLWVKKQEDVDSRYLQVLSCNTGDFATATSITLGGNYSGISGSSFGIAYDQEAAFEEGVVLKSVDDVAFYEGDTAFQGDTLFVQDISNGNWFATNNTGSFSIVTTGCHATDHRPFVRVKNALATTQATRQMSVNTQGFYIIESEANKFYSYRLVSNSTVSSANALRRSLYVLPDSRSYKFTPANGTFITHTGKLGFDLNATIGTDGYLYYTGLLRRVQRTIDGYSPDPVNFPERRAIGSRIETLPSLIKNLSMVLTITTNQGSTIQDITNNVKSAIIDYVNGLGVGQDVILSAVIAKIMQVRGVAAVTFNVPAPNTERISVAPNEKAIITADSIGLS